MFGQFKPADLVAMHFVRPVGEAQCARMRIGAREVEVIADAAGFTAAIVTVAALTGISGLLVAVRMRETVVASPRAIWQER